MIMSSCKICNDNEKIEKDIEEIKKDLKVWLDSYKNFIKFDASHLLRLSRYTCNYKSDTCNLDL